jgi:hypothetical protein
MNLFRSEEHVAQWLTSKNYQRGAVLSVDRVASLAQAWYSDPRDPGWKPRTRDESQAVLRSVGLDSDFWELPV